MEYLARLPSRTPDGYVLVHNSVSPARRLGTRGFRAWLEDVDAANPRRVLCGCDWAPELGAHYRIDRPTTEAGGSTVAQLSRTPSARGSA